MTRSEPLSCQELVELLTDYLDGALHPAERARFDDHLRECDNCLDYLHQMRSTLDLLGRLTPENLGPDMERTLLHAFRTWKAPRAAGA